MTGGGNIVNTLRLFLTVGTALLCASSAWAEHSRHNYSEEAVNLLEKWRQEDRMRQIELEQRFQQDREERVRQDRTLGWETSYPRYGFPSSRPLR